MGHLVLPGFSTALQYIQTDLVQAHAGMKFPAVFMALRCQGVWGSNFSSKDPKSSEWFMYCRW